MHHAPSPESPASFQRRVLLMSTGHTPQVVTETLYALAHRGSPHGFVPTEIHLVTTEGGRRQAALDLMDAAQDRLQQLCAEQDLDRSAIRFDASTVHVITDARGTALEDIRSVEHNHHAADTIVQLVRRLTADPDSALHVSLAGGRKTMGFYLGYALSLFGRPQDRLSHVLVDAPYENLPGFFFPTAAPHYLRMRDGKGTVDASRAKVELAEIPVVYLRGLLGPDLLGDRDARYAEIVRRARGQISAATELHLDLRRMSLSAGGTALPRMGLSERVWYGFFAVRAARGQPGFGWRNAQTRAIAAELRDYVRRLDLELHGAGPDICRPWLTREGEIDATAADRLTTRVNRSLTRVLGPGPAATYRIQRQGRRGSSCYRISLAPDSIHITER